MRNSKIRFEILIIIIAVITALIPRVIIFQKYGAGISNDSFEYLSLGHNISESNEFLISTQLHNIKDNEWVKDSTIVQKRFPEVITQNFTPEPTMFRTPGYPGFVGIVYSIFGENFNYILVVQIFLQIVSILFLYFGLKNLLVGGDTRNSIKKSLLIIIPITIFFSLHPGTIISSRNILRESFEIFLLSGVIYYYSIIQKISGKLFLGLFLGILVLTLQSYIYIIYLIPAVLLLDHLLIKFNHQKLWFRLSKTVLFPLLIAILIIQIWCFRNYQQFNHYSLSSYRSGALMLGIVIQSEAEYFNYGSVSLQRVIEKYKPSKKVEDFILRSSTNRNNSNELRRFYREIYVASADTLINLDSEFKKLAIKIIKKNPQIIIKNIIRATYGTYRSDFYYANLENNSPGHIRYPLSFNKIKTTPSIFDLWAVIVWFFFIAILIYFFMSDIPIFIKLLLLIYILPYSISPAVEERVTVIYNVFVIISIVFLGFKRYLITKTEG